MEQFILFMKVTLEGKKATVFVVALCLKHWQLELPSGILTYEYRIG